MTRYDDTVHTQHREQLEADYRAGKIRPYPRRLTMALDTGAHYGPQVDIACGAREPAVDQWEAGVAVPSWEQLVALATLTGYPVEFFFKKPDPIEVAFICGRGRGGCQTVQTRDVPRFGEPRAEKVTLLTSETLW